MPAYLHDWAPGAVLDSHRALPARIDHRLLGGKDGFHADRTAAEQLAQAVPGFAQGLPARRRFVERALRYLVQDEQVRDVLILGAGLPSLPYLHEVVQAKSPQARVVYVDDDPLVLSHLRAELTCLPLGRLAVVGGKLSDPQRLLGSSAVGGLLAAGRPVAVVVESVLEFIADGEDPQRLVAELMAGLPQGSWLVFSHATSDFASAMWRMIADIYRSHGIEIFPRPREQVAGFLDRMVLTEPGLVPVDRWRPDAQALPELGDVEVSRYGAVGRLALPGEGGAR
ncbi:SAM-dependent methyltransferase [Kitasatospora nipponensis]